MILPSLLRGGMAGTVDMGMSGCVPMTVPMTVTVAMAMPVTVPVMMVMVVVLQQPGAGQVHRQPQQRRADGLVVADGQRMHQPLDRFDQHGQRHPHQQQRAGVATQHLDLPGSKREALVTCIACRHPVGKDRQPQRHRMGTHVPAVGQQGHRIDRPAHTDLHAHHHQRQHQHPARAALGLRIALRKRMDLPAVARLHRGRIRRRGAFSRTVNRCRCPIRHRAILPDLPCCGCRNLFRP